MDKIKKDDYGICTGLLIKLKKRNDANFTY